VPDRAGALAARVASLPAVRFAGVHAYHGGAQHLRTPQARGDAIADAERKVRAALASIAARGLDCAIVTGAGTGTWPLERDAGVWNELQPGSYVFMDADYARNAPGPADLRFEHALFVQAGVMSTPAPGRAICDAGLKAFAFDSGLPLVHARDGIVYARPSDEHGVLEVAPQAKPLQAGDWLRLVPGHCDPTVNLYDWIVGVRGARVECVWAIAARGALG